MHSSLLVYYTHVVCYKWYAYPVTVLSFMNMAAEGWPGAAAALDKAMMAASCL